MTKGIQVIIFLSILFIWGLVVTGCGSYHQIDETLLSNIEGEYRPMDDDLSWMCLSIDREGGAILDDGSSVPYLAIIDDEAGNPGVEGEIIHLDEDTIIIKIEIDFFESLPSSSWKTMNNDSKLEMHYTRSDDKLILENNGKEIEFYDGSNGYDLDDE